MKKIKDILERNNAVVENNELLLKQQKYLYSQLESEKQHHSVAVVTIDKMQKNINSLLLYLNKFKHHFDSLAVEDSKKW